MPSSLIFAALAAAWLAVLVPMVAKRRQEVVRVAESALASRVLRRPSRPRGAAQHDREVPVMSEQAAEQLDERRYRPGRGGYDPEAAALAARERYVFRQRVVLGLLACAVATLLLGLVTSGIFLGMHVMLDLALVGYLAYLRRQVRIEDEVRQRRAARMAGSRSRTAPAAAAHEEAPHEEYSGHQDAGYRHSGHEYSDYPRVSYPQVGAPHGHDEQLRHEQQDEEPAESAPARQSPPPAHPTAVALDLDDEDPMFDELDPTFEPRYRRAAGE